MPKTIKIEVPDWLYKILKPMIDKKAKITLNHLITQCNIKNESKTINNPSLTIFKNGKWVDMEEV